MSRTRIIIFLLIVIAASAAMYAYYQYTRKNKDLAHTAAQVRITSTDLIKTFETNEKQANEKYLDKIIAVTGNVRDVNKDEKGYYTIVLGEQNSQSSVRCSMDTTYQQQLMSINTGNEMTIKGACTGFNRDELLGSDVILNRGVIVTKKNN